MKPSRCSTWGFSSLKKILKASQTWKLPIGIFVRWKVLLHSMHRFCNGFLHNLEILTLCEMCTTFLKRWSWFMHTMKPVLWGLHHVQRFSLHQLRQLDHHIFLQRLKRCTRLHPSYLRATIVAIMPIKLVSATFFSRISFVIIMGKKDIKKLFILPSSRNISNSIYHGKICQHIPLPLNQKPRHLSLPLRLSPPRVILVRMLRRRSTMFKLCKMKSNHWGPNLLI